MRAYPQITMHQILYTLPLSQGIALRAAATLLDPMAEVDMVNGYIRQETRKRQREILNAI